MAKNTRTSKKIEEINSFEKDLFAENVRQDPITYECRKVKCHFNTLICADYGTFMPGDEGEIPEIVAKELEELGKIKILKTSSENGSGE